MKTFQQDPDEQLSYPKDWNDYLNSQGAPAPTISSVDYVVPTASLTVVTSSNTAGITTSLISVNNLVLSGAYICAHRVTLSDSQIVEWPFKIKVKDNREGT